MASEFGLANSFHSFVLDAEACEQGLVYDGRRNETLRKSSGSYYTPADVAHYFWREYFRLKKLDSRKELAKFVRGTRFVEPAAGAGILFFALLDVLKSKGVSDQDLEKIDAVLVDVSDSSSLHLRQRIGHLRSLSKLKFRGVNVITENFLEFNAPRTSKTFLFFGNPPFVSQSGKKWRNLFAEFIDRSLESSKNRGELHFILPLSIAFSRDYQALRKMLVGCGRTNYASHYDNIPDALFKHGKPGSANTNKANSQRCTILTSFPTDKSQVFSTKLHRWGARERQALLSSAPTYFDVSPLQPVMQFVRPASANAYAFLKGSAGCTRRLRDLFDDNGQHAVHVGAVARNFLPIREEPSGCLSFRFGTKADALKFLAIVTSETFFEYWLSQGDGFHVRKQDIEDFPLTDRVSEWALEFSETMGRAWRNRRHFAKEKLNSGQLVKSYDFTSIHLGALDVRCAA